MSLIKQNSLAITLQSLKRLFDKRTHDVPSSLFLLFVSLFICGSVLISAAKHLFPILLLPLPLPLPLRSSILFFFGLILAQYHGEFPTLFLLDLARAYPSFCVVSV
ncbi:hypothetical protein BDV27DRAFT_123013 [Aspergillus caelatus]|uniref:Uncharacterized protein n=1 Tax=Aspergillus caelatus TaxID=61420 RepID=A0A5N7ADM0_9EURO|nr:uncharacterized protein BDV27DRAFT_123013 [Aspergillus caelatus]KAE8367961.1 hypothetical protein BDV27DRAFT_123013 [Aspergillus caelatus]